MCADKEFQLIEGADTEKAREEKLLVSLIPAGLRRVFLASGLAAAGQPFCTDRVFSQPLCAF